MLKRLLEFRFVRTVNVAYIKQEGSNDGETLWVERDFAYNLPETGNAIIRDGNHYRVATKWFDKDSGLIEIDLTDL